LEDFGLELLKDVRRHVLERKACGVRPLLRFPPFLLAGIYKLIVLGCRVDRHESCFVLEYQRKQQCGKMCGSAGGDKIRKKDRREII